MRSLVAVDPAASAADRARAARSRLQPFGLGVVVAVAVVPVAGTLRPVEAVAVVVAGVLLAVAALARPGSLLAPAQWLPGLVGVAVLTAWRHATGGGTGGYGPLYLLPVLWVALYGRRTDLWIVLGGVVVAFYAPLLLLGAPDYPGRGLRSSLVFLLVFGLVGRLVQELLHRERSGSRRTASLLAALGDGVLVTDREGRVLLVNDAMLELTGRDRDDLVGARAPLAFWPPEQHVPVRRAHEEALASGAARLEAGIVRRDGSRRAVTLSVTSVADAQPSETVITTVRDVSDDVRLREHLRAERDRSATIVETMGDGFVLTRGDRLVEANPALCRITGFTRSALVGTVAPFPFWPEEEVARLTATYAGLGPEETVRVETRYRRADGSTFPVELLATPVHDADGTPAGWLTTVRDATERRRAQDEAAERGEMLLALADVTRTVAHAEFGEARQTICDTAREVTGASVAALWELDDDEALQVVCVRGASAAGRTIGAQDEEHPARRALRSRRREVVGPDTTGEAGQRALRRVGAGTACFEPIVADDRTIGVLALSWEEALAEVPRSAGQFIDLLAHESSIAIVKARQHAALERLARTDVLTGLVNRRAFEERFAEELRVAAGPRRDRPVCLVVLDLDRFKEANDAHGHLAGDRLLRSVAARWSTRLRNTDVLARWGGDEFCALLPGCGLDEARAVVDAMRADLPEGCTCSAGVAEWAPGQGTEALVAEADRALYAAKAAGRDRTVLAVDVPRAVGVPLAEPGRS